MAAVNPGATEIECDFLDNDCNPGTSDVQDDDVDGFDCWNLDPALIDCDDGNPNINPGQPEVGCDGMNNDCDPMTPDLADTDQDQFTCADAKIRGGGISSLVFGSGAVTIVNNTITSNQTLPLGIGGGIYLDDIMSGGSSLIVNNIVSSNSAFLGGGVDYTSFFGEIRNNALHNNSSGDLYNGAGSAAVLSSNLFVDPEFVSPFLRNFRLKASSPLIDAADAGPAPQNDVDRVERPFDGDGDLLALPDIGAFEYPSAEVFGLRFVSRDEITWDVRPGEEKFNLYRGTLRQLLLNGWYTQGPAVPQAAQFCGVTPGMLPFVDAALPSTRIYFYLVTLTTPSYEGSLGHDWLGALRPNDNPCP
jgi:hypothetical protein